MMGKRDRCGPCERRRYYGRAAFGSAVVAALAMTLAVLGAALARLSTADGFWFGVAELGALAVFWLATYPAWREAVPGGGGGRGPGDESINFASKGGTQFSADVSASFAIDPSNAPKFFVKFRNDDVAGFAHGYFRNITRDAVNETSALLTPDEIMSEKLTELIAGARARLTREAEAVGVRLVQFGFVGAPRPPVDIARAINSKNQAVQDAVRVENELRVQRAEAAKVVAKAEGDARAAIVRAEAEARANRLVSASVTPTLVQYETVRKWDGALPRVQGGGGGLLIQVPGPGK